MNAGFYVTWIREPILEIYYLGRGSRMNVSWRPSVRTQDVTGIPGLHILVLYSRSLLLFHVPQPFFFYVFVSHVMAVEQERKRCKLCTYGSRLRYEDNLWELQRLEP